MERLTKRQCREQFKLVNKNYYNIGEIFSLKKKCYDRVYLPKKDGKLPDLYIVINSVQNVNLQDANPNEETDDVEYNTDSFCVYEDGTVDWDGPWDYLTNEELKEDFIHITK